MRISRAAYRVENQNSTTTFALGTVTGLNRCVKCRFGVLDVDVVSFPISFASLFSPQNTRLTGAGSDILFTRGRVQVLS